MHLRFLGAAREVTGSCYRVQAAGVDFLVDCGMFQGGAAADRKNRAALAFDVSALDFVLLTHAHIDHSGLLPRLHALGFRGPVYATAATAELLEVMLPDSAHIQAKETEWETHRRHQGGHAGGEAVSPLYTLEQAQAVLGQVVRVAYDEPLRPAGGVACVFRDAGHILGSAILEIDLTEAGVTRRLVCSGDLGQPGRPVMRDPEPIERADVLLVESTYGNRLHRSMAETCSELVNVLRRTLPRGNVVMPAFAVGRTQEILYLLGDLVRQGELGDISVFVDSPMAVRATQITVSHIELLDGEARRLIDWQRGHPDRPRIRFLETAQESMALNEVRAGAVIMSASGMCDAGRIKHHLRFNLPRPECAVLITGFQAEGSLGRRLVDGARTVHIFGEEIPVRASIHTLGGLSAHADQGALLAWLGGFGRPPGRTWVVHGESATADIFAALIRDRLGWPGVAVAAAGADSEL